MGSIIVAVIFIFGFPIAFFIILRSYLRLKKKLNEMSAISEAAFDIDAYAAAKHTEADFYAANKQAEADQAFSAASAKIATLERKIEALTQQRKELSSEVKSLELDVLLGAVRIDDYQNMKDVYKRQRESSGNNVNCPQSCPFIKALLCHASDIPPARHIRPVFFKYFCRVILSLIHTSAAQSAYARTYTVRLSIWDVIQI